MSDSKPISATASFTRPNDTTTYAAGDVMGTAVGPSLEFVLNPAPGAGNPGCIYNGKVVLSANQTLKPTLELWLFSSAPAAKADNAAAAFTDAEMLTFLGILTFTTTYIGNAAAAADGNCVLFADNTIRAIVAQINGTSVFGKLIVRNAYVPVAEEVITVTIDAFQEV